MKQFIVFFLVSILFSCQGGESLTEEISGIWIYNVGSQVWGEEFENTDIYVTYDIKTDFTYVVSSTTPDFLNSSIFSYPQLSGKWEYSGEDKVKFYQTSPNNENVIIPFTTFYWKIESNINNILTVDMLEEDSQYIDTIVLERN